MPVQSHDQTRQDDEEKLTLTRKQLDELIMKYTHQSIYICDSAQNACFKLNKKPKL